MEFRSAFFAALLSVAACHDVVAETTSGTGGFNVFEIEVQPSVFPDKWMAQQLFMFEVMLNAVFGMQPCSYQEWIIIGNTGYSRDVYLQQVMASDMVANQERMTYTYGGYSDSEDDEEFGVDRKLGMDIPAGSRFNSVFSGTSMLPAVGLAGGSHYAPLYSSDDEPSYLRKGGVLTAGTADKPVYLEKIEGLTASSFDEPTYLAKSGVLTAGTADKPVYLQNIEGVTASSFDEPTYLTKDGALTAGTADKPVYLQNSEGLTASLTMGGVMTAGTADKPVYLQKTEGLTASSFDEPTYLTKDGALTAGSADKPVYLQNTEGLTAYLAKGGALTAGTDDEPVYLQKTEGFTASAFEEPTYLTKDGALTAGSADKPVYLQKTEVLTASSSDEPTYLTKDGASTAGSADKPVYLQNTEGSTTYLAKDGVLTAGTADKPVYLQKSEGLTASSFDEPNYLTKGGALTAGTADKLDYLQKAEGLTAGSFDEPSYLKEDVFAGAASQTSYDDLIQRVLTAQDVMPASWTRWSFTIFLVLSAACGAVWSALLWTCCSCWSKCRAASKQQFLVDGPGLEQPLQAAEAGVYGAKSLT